MMGSDDDEPVKTEFEKDLEDIESVTDSISEEEGDGSEDGSDTEKSDDNMSDN